MESSHQQQHCQTVEHQRSSGHCNAGVEHQSGARVEQKRALLEQEWSRRVEHCWSSRVVEQEQRVQIGGIGRVEVLATLELGACPVVMHRHHRRLHHHHHHQRRHYPHHFVIHQHHHHLLQNTAPVQV